MPADDAAADPGVFIVASKPGNASHDDGVHTQQLADFGGGAGIHAAAGAEVLFSQKLVKGFSFNDAVLAVLQQLGNEQVRDSLAHVLIRPPDGLYFVSHGPVIKIHYSHALFLLGEGACSQHKNHRGYPQNSRHSSLAELN